jgi:hypothetical protein
MSPLQLCRFIVHEQPMLSSPCGKLADSKVGFSREAPSWAIFCANPAPSLNASAWRAQSCWDPSLGSEGERQNRLNLDQIG